MKSRLTSILEETLKKTGGLKPATLGETGILSVSKEDKKQLLLHLKEESKSINKIIVAIVAAHFLIFALAVLLVLYFRDSPYVIIPSLGVLVPVLIAILTSLMNVLKTKNKMDLMRTILPNLPPEEVMIVIQSIYFEEKKR
ncbi:MAG: hypothetical protein WA584_16380 [Pyrinomonadaceae bacterium]